MTTFLSLDAVFVRALSLTFCADDCTLWLLTSSCVLFLTKFLRCLSRSLHTATNYCTSSSASKKYPGDIFLTRGIAESYPRMLYIIPRILFAYTKPSPRILLGGYFISPHRQWTIHAVYLPRNWTSGELRRRNAMLTIHFSSNSIQNTIYNIIQQRRIDNVRLTLE